ncbi:MAG: hypothetical protein IJP07_04215 [Firmicutes bacterium]|nr:hypothetical protein [Bacillota bacterium]
MTGDMIAWEERQALTEQLLTIAKAFDEEAEAALKEKTGLYALIYTGKELGGSLWEEPKAQIVYVGRNGKDSIRHWQEDTGVSTVRRSLSAMLQTAYDLIPIPKSDDPDDEDRFANYKLTAESEEKLTAWMKENLQIAFLEVEEEKLEACYLGLLDYNTPMFNFQNNPNNTFGHQVKAYRLRMSEMAATQA